MGLIDYGTVKVYETEDLMEIVFPFDRQLSGHLKSIKGRWNPQRKCWQIKPAFVGKTNSQILDDLQSYFLERAPKKWPEVMKLLRSNACVCSVYEIFCGSSGVRMTFPLSHPYHHHFKGIEGLSNENRSWFIPSTKFKEKVVQEAITRILHDDRRKFSEILDPAIERGVIGGLKISAEEQEGLGLKPENIVVADRSFLQHADPALRDIALRGVAFEVVKVRNVSDRETTVTLEYDVSQTGYDKIKRSIFDDKVTRLTSDMMSDPKNWVQKRL